jgi:hypothetical protein
MNVRDASHCVEILTIHGLSPALLFTVTDAHLPEMTGVVDADTEHAPLTCLLRIDLNLCELMGHGATAPGAR